VLINRGDGSFSPRVDYRTGGGPSSLAIGDLNADGRPDLAVANYDSNSVSVLLNRGDGSFSPRVGYRTGEGPRSVAIGDLNGDGRPDLAVATDADSVSVLINTPGLCNVQAVVRMTLAAAKGKLARANCRVGKVTRAYSKRVKKGRVISQKPKFGTVRRAGAKVALVVSLGRQR
jgi:hypothetical protein